MLVFLFLFLIGFALFISYYFTNKMTNQRKQILLLKHQNNSLKNKADLEKEEQIIVKYHYLDKNQGIIKSNCKLYLWPSDKSSALNSLMENIVVQIHDSAEINEELWYEISILSEDRTNSKGWIKSDCLTFEDIT
ncbi:hypothetical protein [Clostridium thailandense]|uniref:hypothetical protein n=1 Tax=Clostridium thailandense TaxID=2794346 RepID=UPI003989FDD5